MHVELIGMINCRTGSHANPMGKPNFDHTGDPVLKAVPPAVWRHPFEVQKRCARARLRLVHRWAWPNLLVGCAPISRQKSSET